MAYAKGLLYKRAGNTVPYPTPDEFEIVHRDGVFFVGTLSNLCDLIQDAIDLLKQVDLEVPYLLTKEDPLDGSCNPDCPTRYPRGYHEQE